MRRSPARAFLLLAAALSAVPAGAGAQVLDQSQESSNNVMAVTSGSAAWQVFKSGTTGYLTSVDLHLLLNCIMPGMCSGDPGSLTVEIVETFNDVPTNVVVSSGTVPSSAGSTSLAWISVPLSTPVSVTNGTVLAIHLSAGGTLDPMTNKWQWAFNQSDVYAGTAMFWDFGAGDGLDDPVPLDPPSDATFRTFVSSQVCGNGVEEGTEECDDSNTVGGDGCSAECVEEFCGDGFLTGAEECDDGGAVAGDGCDATCAFEPAATACRSAIAKGGSKYASVRLNALLKCKNLLAAGKTLSVDDPAECASETGAAKAIGKAAAAMRKGMASGKKPKCTDALVGVLYACAETVDGMIDTTATSGCLRTTHDASVDELLEQYGY